MVKVKNDLTGKKFGRLTVLKRVEDHVSPKGKCEPKWLCECECGQTKEIIGRSLIYGATLSCGCLSREKASDVCKNRIIDLTGMKFGHLTVISQNTNTSLPHKRIKWDCICECGNECVVSGQSLKSGQTVTCGCRIGTPFKDLTGERFGRLTVIEIAERSKWGIRWRCLCDCGNYCEVLYGNLKNGHVKSCGCYQKEVRDKYIDNCRIDVTGMRFGRLVAIESVGKHLQPSGQTKTLWKCKCDCGNEILAQVNSLTSGQTQSCGCLQKERSSEASLIDLTGKKFGKLTVVKRCENNYITYAMWDCVCDCGNHKNVCGSHLQRGLVSSCGCSARSRGEMKISDFLTDRKIEFIEQKKFGGCADKLQLPFDFYLPEYNMCIEYDGEQHFRPIDHFGGIESLEITKRHDKIKDDFCCDNGIALIRIPYTNFNDIETILSQILS